MIFALLLAGGAFTVVAWLIFNLSVLALPLCVGIGAASIANRTGAGFVGAGLTGLASGVLAFFVGRAAFEKTGSALWRGVLIVAFAAPAALAGYCSTFGIVALLVPAHNWREAFSMAGALATAAVAYKRLSASDPAARVSAAAGVCGRRLERAPVCRATPYSLSGLERKRPIVRRPRPDPTLSAPVGG